MNDQNNNNFTEQDDNLTPRDTRENEEMLANALNSDDSVSGMQHLDEDLEAEDEATTKLENELSEAKDKYLRLVAEFDNFRRRTAKEKMDTIQTAGKEIVKDLLVVLDDTDRASKQMETSEDLPLIKEGVTLVFNKLRNTMLQKGLKKMESINQPFDPDLHEAITEIPAPSEEMVGKIIDETEPGYYLNDKLIRHAKVVVGK